MVEGEIRCSLGIVGCILIDWFVIFVCSLVSSDRQIIQFAIQV